MKYTVHVYPIVRVTVSGVEASSQEEAMKKAEAQTDFHALFDKLGDNIEYADDIDCLLVNVENDPEYRKSQLYDKDYKPL